MPRCQENIITSGKTVIFVLRITVLVPIQVSPTVHIGLLLSAIYKTNLVYKAQDYRPYTSPEQHVFRLLCHVRIHIASQARMQAVDLPTAHDKAPCNGGGVNCL